MKYKFYKEIISTTGTIILGIMPEEEKINVLFRFGDTGWTPQKAQEIIDGIKKSESEKARYEWANEDVHLLSDEHGVFFWDTIARRASKNHPSGQDLELTHNEFISFLEDFKKFIEKNS